MFCCLTASTARALLCIANAEFGIQVIVEVVVACPEPEKQAVSNNSSFSASIPVVLKLETCSF